MKKFGPKALGHPTVGKACPACNVKFEAGDYTALVVLGPGDDPEARRKHQMGLPYNAVAVEVHFSCAGGEQ